MVSTKYIYQIWSAAKAYPIDNQEEFYESLITLRSFGKIMSGNPYEVTGVLTYRDDHNIWAVCSSVITEEGKQIAEIKLQESPLPDGIYYWLASKFNNDGEEDIRLIMTNNSLSENHIGEVWTPDKCWTDAGIYRINIEEDDENTG